MSTGISGLRTRKLKTISEKLKISVLHFPTRFDVRWTEFTSSLLNTISSSWLALVLYFNENGSTECKGYYDFLTKHENIKLISSLADILSVFAYLKKKLHPDLIIILDISKQTLPVDGLKKIDLIGG